LLVEKAIVFTEVQKHSDTQVVKHDDGSLRQKKFLPNYETTPTN